MTERGRITVRSAKPTEARTLHALISSNLAEGHLLPRALDELTRHADRFVVAIRGRRVTWSTRSSPSSGVRRPVSPGTRPIGWSGRPCTTGPVPTGANRFSKPV